MVRRGLPVATHALLIAAADAVSFTQRRWQQLSDELHPQVLRACRA